MKNILMPLVMFGSLVTFSACSEKQEKPAVMEQGPAEMPQFNSVSGIVTTIQPGKDGYTATMLTSGEQAYLVTVSRANLKDPQTFKSVKIGDSLHVIGEQWEMENETHITAREIR